MFFLFQLIVYFLSFGWIGKASFVSLEYFVAAPKSMSSDNRFSLAFGLFVGTLIMSLLGLGTQSWASLSLITCNHSSFDLQVHCSNALKQCLQSLKLYGMVFLIIKLLSKFCVLIFLVFKVHHNLGHDVVMVIEEVNINQCRSWCSNFGWHLGWSQGEWSHDLELSNHVNYALW